MSEKSDMTLKSLVVVLGILQAIFMAWGKYITVQVIEGQVAMGKVVTQLETLNTNVSDLKKTIEGRNR